MPGRKKPVMKDQGGFFWIITEKMFPGKEAGQNNRRLAQQETPVECCEMGIISNDGSHLCFYTPGSISPDTLNNKNDETGINRHCHFQTQTQNRNIACS